MKKLYRSREDRILLGVFGGLGEYFHVDPTLLRIAYVFLAVFTAFVPALFVYFLTAIIIPITPVHTKKEQHHAHNTVHVDAVMKDEEKKDSHSSGEQTAGEEKTS